MKNFEYNITEDKEFIFTLFDIPGALLVEFPELYADALKGGERIIRRLKTLTKQYPHVPQLVNYLSVALQSSGRQEEGYALNHQLVAEHPDYLFGKLNLAHEYFRNEAYDEIPKLLGHRLELQELYPERDTFHISEVTGFMKIAIMYYCATGNLAAAEPRYDLMDEIAENHPDTRVASQHISSARIKAATERIDEENRTRISVKTPDTVQTPQVTTPPEFRNAEIHWLYKNGLHIDHDRLTTILSLPKKELIEDLRTVLKDSMSRFTYFSELAEKEGWNEETMSFPLHAIYLLGELRATECLPDVLETFSQGQPYIELWFGDFITGTLWEPLYYMAGEQLDLLLKFVLTPGIYTYARSEVCASVVQIAYHHPERKKEITSWFMELFTSLAGMKKEDNIIDSDFSGLAVCDAMELLEPALLPHIKALFERGYVNKGVSGSYEAVEKDLMNYRVSKDKRDLLNIFDRYQQIVNIWAGYTEEEEPQPGKEEPLPETNKSVLSARKIGRNDPCPCGSGKKYKKCCLLK